MSRLTTPAADLEIREALRRYVSREHKGARQVILEELGLFRGLARIDMAVVNGSLHGYEIKSDRDSLRRLKGQVSLYNRVFDRATLVVGRRHLQKACEMIPDWWEILRVDSTASDPSFRLARPGRDNPARDPRSLVELIWLDDALALLEERGLAKGVRGKPRRLVWDKVCKHLDLDEIAAAVRTHLKARRVGREISPTP
jgi:hypothetical protein